MRIVTAALSLLACIAFLSGCGADSGEAPNADRDAAVKKPPRVARDTQEFDFGLARQNAVIKHEFTVTNPGPDPLEVMVVQTTCGCTVASVKKGEIIAPGSSIQVPLEVKLHGKKGNIESKAIISYVNNAKPLELIMKGSVAEEYPDSLNFEKFKRGERPEETVELTTYDGQPPLEIKEMKYDKSKIEVVSKPGSAPGTYELRISPLADIAHGPFSEGLTIVTNDTEAPEKQILVRGSVIKKLEGARNRVAMYPEKEGEPASVVVEFKSPYGEPITNATAQITRPKRFTTSIEPLASDGSLRVRVTAVREADGTLKKDYLRAMLTVSATVGGTQEEATTEIYLMPKKPDVELPDKADPDAHEHEDNSKGQ
ncbi:MAG TPA: DUF1573 domain-containing protein [Candidatus Hydrogenedentes bacterium]|nr:DUF1573 domain-containing protein [Candidatus Hydrogenedentota bacterium]